MMDVNKIGRILVKEFGEDRIRFNELMIRHTTFRIGGIADLYFEAHTADEVQFGVKVCQAQGLPYFVLGVGANLLVGDRGIRGLVIRPLLNEIEVLGPFKPVKETVGRETGKGQHYQAYDEQRYLKFDDLEMTEPPADTLVRVGAGVVLPQLIIWSLEQNLTGLQNFAGIPASIGGSVYNNIHGGTRLFNEFVHEVTLLDEQNQVLVVPHDQMGFAYDQSRLQRTKEIVLNITLALSHGEIEKARRVRLEWLKRKLRVQPQKDCPGCIFKNISPAEAQRIGAPTVATAWIIDQGLGLKGRQIGGAKVSEKHANFFVNTGLAKATEVLELIKLVKFKAKERFGLDLVEEIQLVGEF